MKMYVLKGSISTIQVLFKYDLNGYLMAFEIQGFANQEQRAYLIKKMPWLESQLEVFKKDKLTVTEVPADLSFNVFWTAYNYKVGNKKQVEKLWNELSETERTIALVKVRQYSHWLQLRTNMEKAYPQTFLAQRRWENDFR